MNRELKPCPFCGGKSKISFKDYRFYGMNFKGDKKISYRIQVICNKCKSRGKPIITQPMINPMPYITVWGNCYGGSDKAKSETERFNPYIEKAIESLEQEGNRMNRESERKRLVELLKGSSEYITEQDSLIERIANHLLDNGIVVPPVKVGQTVYIVAQISQIIVETKAMGVWTNGDRCNIITDQGIILMNAIGKTAFTSREEALAKLKGGESDA